VSSLSTPNCFWPLPDLVTVTVWKKKGSEKEKKNMDAMRSGSKARFDPTDHPKR
jgi:hypothetical protein